jgi:hypothetical protein
MLAAPTLTTMEALRSRIADLRDEPGRTKRCATMADWKPVCSCGIGSYGDSGSDGFTSLSA